MAQNDRRGSNTPGGRSRNGRKVKTLPEEFSARCELRTVVKW